MKKGLLFALCGLSTAAFSQTFNGGTGPIYDNQTIDIPVVVSGLPTTIDTNNFGLETVCLNITHTYVGDVTVWIVAPDGTAGMLFSNVGGGGQNFTNTCVNENGSLTFGANSAPFTGTFQPTGQMGLVNNGQNPNGTWYLRVNDNYGADEGTVNSFSITFGNSPATYFSFTESWLPIVDINTNGNVIADDPKVAADMRIINNGQGNRNHLSDPANEYDGKIGIEYRGNYSASLPQKPYGFETWDVNGNAIDTSFFGMSRDNDWILLACYNDKSFARNILPFSWFDSLGHYSVRSQLVDVVMNGEYQGIYLFCEKIKRDGGRVDIDKLEPTEITYPDNSGGYILKIDYWDNSNSWQLSHSPIGFPGLDIHMVHVEPEMQDLMPQQLNYIHDYIDDFENALYGSDFDDPILGYNAYIGDQSFVDYFLVNEITRNVDGFKKSRFFSKDKDNTDGTVRKLKAGPVWDFDWSQKDMWGGSEDGSEFMYDDCDQDVDAPGWYIRLLQDTNFANLVRCRYEDFRRTIWSEAEVNAAIDNVAAQVAESQAWHYQVWGHLGVATGTPEVQTPSQTYAEEVQRLKDWYSRRFTWLDANLPGTLNGCSFTGVNELSFNADVYPNPFTSTILIETQQIKGDLTVRLIDASGRIVREEVKTAMDFESGYYSLENLTELKSGLYWLELSTSEMKTTIKLLK